MHNYNSNCLCATDERWCHFSILETDGLHLDRCDKNCQEPSLRIIILQILQILFLLDLDGALLQISVHLQRTGKSVHSKRAGRVNYEVSGSGV
jgi:hypothetical protein